MSTDAFAAAVCKGASLARPRFSEALRTGLIFGVIETLTPLLGWLLGSAAAPLVEAWDHWIAFVLLGGLGLHMIRAGLSPDDDEAEKPARHGFWRLALTAVGTSIDALAIGVGLAFLDVNIWVTALAIGCATTLMVTIGVMVGRLLGSIAGRRAEVAGGVVLIAIGSWILVDHLGLLVPV
jgi:putative Mn2+ efflux pump MntP